MTHVLDAIKMTWYKHAKVAIPETISQNKIVVLGQYVTKLEKVILTRLLSNFLITFLRNYNEQVPKLVATVDPEGARLLT